MQNLLTTEDLVIGTARGVPKWRCGRLVWNLIRGCNIGVGSTATSGNNTVDLSQSEPGCIMGLKTITLTFE